MPDAHDAYNTEPDKPEPKDPEPSEREGWKQAEDRTAEASGGEKQIGSGKFEPYKGDVDTEDEKFEVKSTKTKGLYLSEDVLEKICREARDVQKRPRLAVFFKSDEIPDGWCVMPMDDYELLKERAEES